MFLRAPSLVALALLAAVLLAATGAGQGEGTFRSTPKARAQTTPVPHGGDAADDPAIWIHPRDPALSLVLGTDKQGALHSYQLDGREKQRVSDGCQPNNVDVLYQFSLDGRKTDLAVASVRGRPALGVKVWRLDPRDGWLVDVTRGEVLTVCAGSTPYGLCTYRSPRSGESYFFVSDRTGRVEQWRLFDDGRGRVGAERVRTQKFSSTVEGMVADEELGRLYLGEETIGIWEMDAEPSRDRPTLIAKIGQHGFRGEVEGLAIYYAAEGRGCLIASDQGSNTFRVYDRGKDHPLLAIIDPADGDAANDNVDDVSDTDGLAVINLPTSRQFPSGFLVVQDGRNARGNQNFKLYGWEDIAGRRLPIETKWTPRGMAKQ